MTNHETPQTPTEREAILNANLSAFIENHELQNEVISSQNKIIADLKMQIIVLESKLGHKEASKELIGKSNLKVTHRRTS